MKRNKFGAQQLASSDSTFKLLLVPLQAGGAGP